MNPIFREYNQNSRWIKEYLIGSGSYGDVYKGYDKITEKHVAIKVIKSPLSEDGIPVDTLREIVILKDIEHPNIIRMHDAFINIEKTYLIFDYMSTDLKNFIDSFPINEQIPIQIIKTVLKQILQGLEYLDYERILHRDLKPQNILVNFDENFQDISVKLADFGLARTYSILNKNFSKNTSTITYLIYYCLVTPLYRAPEIFFDVTEYSSAVDIWSVGCIFAEMINRKPLFNANYEIDVLKKILQFFGKPYYKFSNNKEIKFNITEQKPKSWHEIFPGLDEIGLDLISKMLVLEQENRISAKQALKHEFFIN